MARRWPSDLPAGIAPGYRLTPMDQAIRTDMEVGSKRLRRITSARRDMVEVQWKLTDVEMHGFRAWFGDEAWSLAGDSDSLAAWTPALATVTQDVSAGPGLALADRLTDTAASGFHHAGLTLAPGALPGSTLLCRASLRSALGLTWARLALYGWDNVARFTNINLATGALGNQSGLLTRAAFERSGGWWRVELTCDTGTGVIDPALRLSLLDDSQAASYTGTGAWALDVCEINARPRSGYDLALATDAGGRAVGAAGGSAWVLMPLAFGGGLRTVEARFDGPWNATALPGLGWQVSGRLEVRNA